jgi:uncharacterized cupin superfamily protein
MQRINLHKMDWTEWPASPKGKFAQSSKLISESLGHVRGSDSKRETHPFDLELCRVPPGRSPCPYHSHSAQFELYLVVSGSGKIRSSDGWSEFAPGDAVIFPPGEPHQILNNGEEDLLFYIIADNPIGEACYYPDSDKWSLPKILNGPVLKGNAVDYYEGEE